MRGKSQGGDCDDDWESTRQPWMQTILQHFLARFWRHRALKQARGAPRARRPKKLTGLACSLWDERPPAAVVRSCYFGRDLPVDGGHIGPEAMSKMQQHGGVYDIEAPRWGPHDKGVLLFGGLY